MTLDRVEAGLVLFAGLGIALTMSVPRWAPAAAHSITRPVAPQYEPMETTRRRLALEDTARFIDQEMPALEESRDRNALFRKSIGAVKVDGMFCEFGVATGETINFIASLTPRQVHGFDSFEGLPEPWYGRYTKGYFAMPALPKVSPNVILHKGWFDQVLPGWKAKHLGPVAFLHMDADLYSSTKTVLEGLSDRIVPGTVIQFDEFFAYPGWRNNGEFKAFREFVAAHGVRYEYLGYSVVPTLGGVVAVRIL